MSEDGRLLEEAAILAYREAVLCYGVSPTGKHAWEMQTAEGRYQWLLIASRLKEFFDDRARRPNHGPEDEVGR